ncbi:MAG: hypothetical protein ABIR52_10075 [Casimicrobiaceae bacterium]
MNGLSLLLLIALAIGIVVAYRAGIARGARQARASLGPRATLTADAPTRAPASGDIAAAGDTAAVSGDAVADPAAPAATKTAPWVALAESFGEERHALHRALADARGETARYRQLVVDLENDAPPPLLDGPGSPDDLKLIVGIGPVLERMLQQLGVSRYRQIARWSERDIDEFDARLPEFPGRIRRDGWVTQARALHQSKFGEALPSRGAG